MSYELLIWDRVSGGYIRYGVWDMDPQTYPLCCKTITYPCKDVRPLISQETT